jgi:hypothetical protein
LALLKLKAYFCENPAETKLYTGKLKNKNMIKEIALFTILLCAFINCMCQNKYDDFLAENKLIDMSKEDMWEPLKLKSGFSIKFAKNDSLIYVVLVNNKFSYPILTENMNLGKRLIGGKCADLKSCFFLGKSIMGNIYGNIYFKSPSLRKSDDYIYVDADLENETLFLAKYNGSKAVLFSFNSASNFLKKLYCKNSVQVKEIKYLRYFRRSKAYIELKNVKTGKISHWN